MVEEADEAVLRTVTKTVEGLIELAGKEVVRRLVCRSSGKPGCEERTADGMHANKLSPVVRAQRAEQQAWGTNESFHWSMNALIYACGLSIRIRRTGG